LELDAHFELISEVTSTPLLDSQSSWFSVWRSTLCFRCVFISEMLLQIYNNNLLS